MAWTAPLICSVIALSVAVETGCLDDSAPAVTAPGDLIIAGLFPIHEDVDRSKMSWAPHPLPCIRFAWGGLTSALAMINAIEVLNKSPLMTDVNVTLGYQIVDSCHDVSTALRATADLSQRSIVALVGASYSELSIAVARQLTLEMIPQISYSSTAVILSDKSRFPAFMRTIPNDHHQTAAMVSLLSTFGWNWVGMVTTDGDYGRSALDHFVTQAAEKGICVAFRSVLPQSVTSPNVQSAIIKTAETIHTNPKVQVIVSFARPIHMMHLFQELRNWALRAGQGVESMRRVWVASDSWSSSNSVTRNLTLQDIGHVVGFSFKHGDPTSFSKYLSRLEAGELNCTGRKRILQELYKHLNSNEGHADPKLVEVSDGPVDPELLSRAVSLLKKHSDPDNTFSVQMAVSALANAVASICRSRDCKTPGNVQPWQVLEALRREEFTLRGNTYKFDSNGDVNLGYDVTMWRSEGDLIHVNDVVTEYHPLNCSFTHSKTRKLQLLQNVISRCSKNCVPGEFKKTAESQHTCCYECINCTENYFSNSTDMDQCLSCEPNTEWSAQGSSSCTPKALRFFSWQDSFAAVLLSFSAMGVLLALLVLALFLHKRDTPVVKAAGGSLSHVILLSLVVSYVSAVLFVGRPSNLQCKARQVLFGISFTLCVSCILVKSLKIILAFQFNPELQVILRWLHKPYAIISISVAGQVATCICWLVLRSPFKDVTSYQTEVLENCNEGSYVAFGVMLGYIAVLAFICFICAFKGRKLPQQFNEARFITFSMLLYLVSWLLFIPIYVTTTGVYLPAVEMVVILISNYGILGCHFFPKCYIILFKRDQNNTSAFRKKLYEYSRKISDLVTVSVSSESQQQSSPSFSSKPSENHLESMEIKGQMPRDDVRLKNPDYDHPSNDGYRRAVHDLVEEVKKAFPHRPDMSALRQLIQGPNEPVEEFLHRAEDVFNHNSGLTRPADLGSVLLQFVDDLLLCSPSADQCQADTLALLQHLCLKGHKASHLVLFVDGSSSRDSQGRNRVGYAVCSSYATLASGTLPAHYSAQTAELVDLTEAFHHRQQHQTSGEPKTSPPPPLSSYKRAHQSRMQRVFVPASTLSTIKADLYRTYNEDPKLPCRHLLNALYIGPPSASKVCVCQPEETHFTVPSLLASLREPTSLSKEARLIGQQQDLKLVGSSSL
ncbi:G-protein coupled receptor family C group 6 member A [Xenentodon cancila]